MPILFSFGACSLLVTAIDPSSSSRLAVCVGRVRASLSFGVLQDESSRAFEPHDELRGSSVNSGFKCITQGPKVFRDSSGLSVLGASSTAAAEPTEVQG